jgi:hypothetical protein
MTVIDEADSELRRYRDAALTNYARCLVAAGADVDGAEFRTAMLKYGRQVEAWRIAGLSRIKRFVNAGTVQRDDSAAVH